MKDRIILAVWLILITLTWGCSRSTSYEKPPVPVRVLAVEHYAGESGHRYSATVKPHAQIELAFRTGGYIQELIQVTDASGRTRPLQEGDSVRKGAILAKIRESDYKVKVDQAKAQLDEAEAALEQARLDFERAEYLFSRRSLVKTDYDAARARHIAAQARLKAAGAALDEAVIAFEDTALKAPVDGIILKRTIEPGAYAAPGTPVLILADTASMKVVFGASDIAVQGLRLNTKLYVSSEAIPDVRFQGYISRIAPSADPASRIFEVEITIPNPQNRLKVGMIVSVIAPSPKPSQAIPAVPLTAIVRPKGGTPGYALFVVEGKTGDETVKSRLVTIGEVVENMVTVPQGLKRGERVVVSGTQFLSDNEKVKIIP